MGFIGLSRGVSGLVGLWSTLISSLLIRPIRGHDLRIFNCLKGPKSDAIIVLHVIL